ncbi:MAG: N-acetylglucosamine-6-phosphate deacetylase, partial [Clostridia bacterium]|nr:N-acetylglucosamine-6-phosphate deacetylase [Clostridia bacterium]
VEDPSPVGAEGIGVHLEGPFDKTKKCGAQPKEYIIKPSEEFIENLQKEYDGLKLITVAPEIEGMSDFILFLQNKHITVSVGHTAAKFKEFKRAQNLGVRSVTHTFNAMSPFTHREVGVAGGSMYLPVYNELIADGLHVDFTACKILGKIKGDKIILITDSMRAKGMGDGVSELGGQTVYVKNGEARLESGVLAGSVLTLDKAFKNAIDRIGLTEEQAIKAVTENPAANLGVLNEMGSIAVGKKANFTVINSDHEVVSTFVGGQKIFEKKQ